MTKKTTLALLTGAALIGGAAAGLVGIASAQTTTDQTSATQATSTAGWMRGKGLHLGWTKHGHGPGMMGHGVGGTVTAVDGTTITITGKNGTTYTIDASKAALNKIVTISTSDVKVGDTIEAQGAVSGTSVSAVHIMDGMPGKPAQ